MNSNMNCNCSMDCKALLKHIDQVSFAIDDVVLYLDTHPTDKEAFNYYRYVVDLRERAVKAYETQCGPLMADGVMDKNCFAWIQDPWPWEGACS